MSVKYTFKKLGPIKGAELSLGDLTVIAGGNNSGKTYLTYSLYGFLEEVHDLSPFFFVRPRNRLIKVIKRDTRITCSFKFKEFVERFRKHTDACSESFNKKAANFFSAEGSLFKGAEIHGEITGREYSSDKIINMFSHVHRIVDKPSYDKRTDTVKIVLDNNPPTLNKIIHLTREAALESLDVLHWKVFEMIAAAFMKEFFCSNPFILAAERIGVSLFYKELDFAKNRQLEEVKEKINGNIGDILIAAGLRKYSADYAKPIKDNIDYTRGLSSARKKISALAESKLFDNIKEMMQGSYLHKDDEIRFVSKTRGKNGFNIPLHAGSSSVRELSNLYFYLMHTAEEGQLLIIDEPESHLDPDRQIEMARLLVRCVNAGMKVLITTHSDYMIREFNNLIMLSSNFKGKKEFLRENKKHYGSKDLLRQEQIKGYLCKGGTLKPCEVNRYGIRMGNFDEAIKSMNDISNTLGFMLRDEERQLGNKK